MEKTNAWKKYDVAALERLEAFCADYRNYLDNGKTERECVKGAVALAEAKGFISLEAAQKLGRRLVPGDRVYVNWMNKCFMAFVIGKKPLETGMNILGAHIDSPRIDVKQNPMYEADGFCYFDTHYYGGIKKYQWVALPLALHGVVVKKNGEKVDICVGEDAGDPVLCISDLLPHLAQDQMKKNAAEVVVGEDLDLLVGSRPLAEEEKEPVKAAVLKLLADKYGIEESDFHSAELEAVPAGKTREMGLDRSMILGYGHDDRVCAYPSLRACVDVQGIPETTACCVLTDKEEIGSVGATGMDSQYFENTVAELVDLCCEKYSELTVRRALANSRMLSSDVGAGYDPTYAAAFEKKNASVLGSGVCFLKFTGARGKSGSSDATAEYVAEIRRIMNDANVNFQLCELSRVDVGGGGTIAFTCAKYGMNVIDCGVPVLSMHAPWEIVSKADVYEAYCCYIAFLANA